MKRKPTTVVFDLDGRVIDALARAIARELTKPRPLETFLQFRREAQKHYLATTARTHKKHDRRRRSGGAHSQHATTQVPRR